MIVVSSSSLWMMAKEANLATFGAPSPLLAHHYHHKSPTTTANPCRFVLGFTDVSYTAVVNSHARLSVLSPKTSKSARILLNNISGEVSTGEVLAVLGPSGSGKTTLLDALANRIDRTCLRGSITLNGGALNSRLLKANSAYVMQDDLLYSMLTVEETLTFAAELRLPSAISAARKKERVRALIDQLDLRAAANTIIGDEGHRGVSGGERRRVSIGTDIVHDPAILFLDEPTSGLDSTSAFNVVRVMHNLARSGRIVVMTVHQPSFRILGLIDHLIVLSRGRAVFTGPPRLLPELLAAFGSPIPDGANPAEVALDLVRELEETAPDSVDALARLNATILEARSGGTKSGRTMVCDAPAPASFANPLWLEVVTLAKRSLTNTWRMPKIMAFRLGEVLATGILLGTIFWRLGDTPSDVRARAVFFSISLATIFFSTTDSLAALVQERYIYARETAYNAYRCSSYVIANALIGFLPLVALTLALTSVTFFAVGLSGGMEGFAVFFATVLAAFWAGSGFVTFLSGVVSHLVVGYTVAAAVISYFLLLSGFFVERRKIPAHWIWLHYTSLVKYPYEALMQNEFGSESPPRCFSRGADMLEGTAMAGLPTAKKLEVLAAIAQLLGARAGKDACMATGLDVLEGRGIDQLSKWNCVLVTLAWGFFFRVLFYLSLVFGSTYKRK